MRKQILIVMLIIGSMYSGYGQRQLSIVDIEVKVNMSIVKREGKKPEKKEVLVNVYSIIYEIPHRNNRGKFIQFTKHIETYKKKKIRELIFSTGLQEGYRERKINLKSVEDVVNTYRSTTRAELIKYVYANRAGFYDYEAGSFKEKDITSRIRQRKTKAIELSEFFFSKMPDEEFLNYLNDNKVDKKSITELLDLKHYGDKRIEKLRKIEAEKERWRVLILRWQDKNVVLENKLKRWTPNKGDVDIDVDYYEKDSIQFRLLEARFKWKDEFSKSSKTEYRNDKLLQIKYPKGSPYAGEVYLKLVKGVPAKINLLEVHKSTTKAKVPFNRLRLGLSGGFSSKKITVYGLKGTLNNVLDEISSEDEFYEQNKILSKSTDKVEVPAGQQIFEVNLESEKYKNYYLEGKATTSEKEYHAYYDRKKKEREENIQAIIDAYDLSREESIQSNGFFLETRDFETNREDEDIDIALNLIYKGRFDVMKSYSWIDDIVISAIANQFMRKQAVKCGVSHIPSANVVPVMDEVCVEEAVTRNGYGVVVSRSCSKWEDRPSGLYTSKELFQANARVKNRINKKVLSTAFKMLINREETLATQRIVSEILGDLDKMLRLNGCGSEAIDRFEENLIRFINDERPLKLKKN